MKYGVIGEHLKHSFSKEIHAQIGDYQYEIKEIEPENLEAFIKERDFLGINVTIPYKEKVIPMLDCFFTRDHITSMIQKGFDSYETFSSVVVFNSFQLPTHAPTQIRMTLNRTPAYIPPGQQPSNDPVNPVAAPPPKSPKTIPNLTRSEIVTTTTGSELSGGSIEVDNSPRSSSSSTAPNTPKKEGKGKFKKSGLGRSLDRRGSKDDIKKEDIRNQEKGSPLTRSGFFKKKK